MLPSWFSVGRAVRGRRGKEGIQETREGGHPGDEGRRASRKEGIQVDQARVKLLLASRRDVQHRVSLHAALICVSVARSNDPSDGRPSGHEGGGGTADPRNSARAPGRTSL